MTQRKGIKIDYKALNRQTTFTLIEVINYWHSKTVIATPITNYWDDMPDEMGFLLDIFRACNHLGCQEVAGKHYAAQSGIPYYTATPPSSNVVKRSNNFTSVFGASAIPPHLDAVYTREGLQLFAKSIGAKPWFLFPEDQRGLGKTPKQGTKRYDELKFKKEWAIWYNEKRKSNANVKAVPNQEEMKRLLRKTELKKCPVEKHTMSNWGSVFSKNPSKFRDI